VKCDSCGAALDTATATCPSCGSGEVARLAGILGVVCGRCDSYNDAATTSCAACGDPLGLDLAAALAGAEAPSEPAHPLADAGELLDVPVEVVPAEAAARLVIERGEAAPGTAFPLVDEELQAGRSQALLAFPDDPCLAPLHATFVLRDGAVFVRDEGAAGGVYVRFRGASLPLRPGTLFAVGDRLLRFAGMVPPPPAAAPDGTRRLGAPRPDRPAVLIEEWLEGGMSGRAWLRAGPSVTIGRSGCAVDLGDDRFLSQAHAEIALDATGAAELRDLGAADGTFVRMPPGSERELRDGDAVRVGREVLRLEVG
jgi:hypothetical protein